ncbi:MAG: phenylacetate-CoA oxygenase subunit PaaI [Rhodospirillaceae bacterium]|nr:phenylacetate-CoA oxygenase subunit PaaI [Rhodospirillaceae bacterium]MCA8933562.1 phenylacetate-CoA oxygenase subunit PaaI [Rhodospirillaceae bacterium]
MTSESVSDDAMPIDDYLAEGGKLSAPENAPPRYRAELLRLMASFVDSEMAGASGFADMINAAPGIEARIAAAKITAEKFAHARRILTVMGDFGANVARYAEHLPWAERLPRDADMGAKRHGGDMRLSVFHYPFAGWADAVVMNVLMGRATVIQLTEAADGSYQPLADAFLEILPFEVRHAELGEEGLKRIVQADGTAQAQASIGYWTPRVAATFGGVDSGRFEALKRFGLRRTPNAALLDQWHADVRARLAPLGLNF